MDKPRFEVGDEVRHVDQKNSVGKVTKVIATYEYEVEWGDYNPPWDIHEQYQLEKK